MYFILHVSQLRTVCVFTIIYQSWALIHLKLKNQVNFFLKLLKKHEKMFAAKEMTYILYS